MLVDHKKKRSRTNPRLTGELVLSAPEQKHKRITTMRTLLGSTAISADAIYHSLFALVELSVLTTFIVSTASVSVPP